MGNRRMGEGYTYPSFSHPQKEGAQVAWAKGADNLMRPSSPVLLLVRESEKKGVMQCGAVSADKGIWGEVGELRCFLALFLGFIPFFRFFRKFSNFSVLLVGAKALLLPFDFGEREHSSAEFAGWQGK